MMALIGVAACSERRIEDAAALSARWVTVLADGGVSQSRALQWRICILYMMKMKMKMTMAMAMKVKVRLSKMQMLGAFQLNCADVEGSAILLVEVAGEVPPSRTIC
jgi:hypothetical protein